MHCGPLSFPGQKKPAKVCIVERHDGCVAAILAEFRLSGKRFLGFIAETGAGFALESRREAESESILGIAIQGGMPSVTLTAPAAIRPHAGSLGHCLFLPKAVPVCRQKVVLRVYLEHTSYFFWLQCLFYPNTVPMSKPALAVAITLALLSGCKTKEPVSIGEYAKNLSEALKKQSACETNTRAALKNNDSKALEVALDDLECRNADQALHIERQRISGLVKEQQDELIDKFSLLPAADIELKRQTCGTVPTVGIESILLAEANKPLLSECEALKDALGIALRNETIDKIVRLKKEHELRVESAGQLSDQDFAEHWAVCRGADVIGVIPWEYEIKRPEPVAKHNERYWGNVPEVYSECHAYYEIGLDRLIKMPWHERNEFDQEYCLNKVKQPNIDQSFCGALAHVGFEKTVNYTMRMRKDTMYYYDMRKRCNDELEKEPDPLKRQMLSSKRISDRELCDAVKNYKSEPYINYTKSVF